MGVAVTDLKPEGIVRVRGETWSATSLNGEQPAGTLIQVISVRGIRLEVWGEEPAETRRAARAHRAAAANAIAGVLHPER